MGETRTCRNIAHALRPLNLVGPFSSLEPLSLQGFSIVSGYPTSSYRYNTYKRAHSSTSLGLLGYEVQKHTLFNALIDKVAISLEVSSLIPRLFPARDVDA